MKYFKLTEETKQIGSITLYRIELTEDCKWGKVGDKGGWVEKQENLNGGWVSDDAQVYGNAWVYGHARVSGNAHVYDNAIVSGNARVFGYALVSGNAQVSGNALVYGNAKVYGDALVSGDAWEKSPIQIKGSKHFLNESKKGHLRIGCIEKSIADWEKQFEQVGKEYGYDEKQIKEYVLYIQLAKQLNTL
jgi:carbonic anhydrase/acetyltransferase-like protein (isoleucine patch superfamily)